MFKQLFFSSEWHFYNWKEKRNMEHKNLNCFYTYCEHLKLEWELGMLLDYEMMIFFWLVWFGVFV